MNARVISRFDLRILVAPLLVAACAVCGQTGTTGPEPGQTPASLDGTDPPQQPASDPPVGGTPVPSQEVDTLVRSSVSGLIAPRRQVVRSAPDWVGLWDELAGPFVPADPVPAVDFSTHQVVVLAMGTQPTGGYSIELGPLRLAGDTLRVVVRERSPGASCMTTQVLTQPVLVVRLPLMGDEVLFVEEPVVADCG